MVVRKKNFRSLKALSGLTLVELIIVVAIVGVLAAVAIPSYQGYIRRGYLSEATSSIPAIKSAQEAYFTINGCYIEAVANPASIPRGTKSAWNAAESGWNQAGLNVRPDPNVRFQYRVVATNSVGCAAPTGTPATIVNAGDFAPTSCIAANRVGAGGVLVDTNFTSASNWYVISIRGDLNGNGVASNIVSAVDNSTIFMCNELE
jgi:prepilin-type N-terminal cleavage/methylation domain-containing protein